MHERMKNLEKYGESRHKAKEHYKKTTTEEKPNPAYAKGIHSINTYDAYKQTSVQFVKWLKSSHSEIKHIDDVGKDVVIDYLQSRRDQGLSPWTLSKDMSALNKILNLKVTKKMAELPQRSFKTTTRSRGFRKHDLKYNPKNYEKQIDVAKAFGVRRESILGGKYQLKEGSIYRHKGELYAAVAEKGGRFRNAPCLKSMESTILKHFPHIEDREELFEKDEFKEMYEKSGKEGLGDHLFNRYTTNIDNHAFRGVYARNYYKEYETTLKATKSIKNDYRGFNEEVCRKVSDALGHNRPSIIVEHYLR